MEKIDIINKFLEEKDIKPHELVYWKHKVSNGFDLKKFMADFLDYAESKQSNIPAVINRRELLVAFNKEMAELHIWFLPAEDSMIDEFLSNQ
jgi:hypothetical protein